MEQHGAVSGSYHRDTCSQHHTYSLLGELSSVFEGQGSKVHAQTEVILVLFVWLPCCPREKHTGIFWRSRQSKPREMVWYSGRNSGFVELQLEYSVLLLTTHVTLGKYLPHSFLSWASVSPSVNGSSHGLSVANYAGSGVSTVFPPKSPFWPLWYHLGAFWFRTF